MDRMTGGQALIKSLIPYGIDTIFSLPGLQLDYLFDAIFEERSSVRIIQTRHEQGAAYMAFGYAQSTGRVGTYAVVPGSGVLNTTAALSNAYACNVPVLCISGQINLTQIGRGIGWLHELPDQLAILRGLTKWAERIKHPSETPNLVREAFKQLTVGRIRPVAIEIPMDILAMEAQVKLLEPITNHEVQGPDPDLIDKAAQLLGQAENPMIFVGPGVFGAEESLLELAEMLQAPVVMTRGAFGCISSRHYLALNKPAGHRLWADVDVALAVGTRLRCQISDNVAQNNLWDDDDQLKIIRMDIDPEEVNRVFRPEVGIVSDAEKGLTDLVDRIPKYNSIRASREKELKALKAKIDQECNKFMPQMAFIRSIREELPDDGIFVEELTQIGHVARFAFPAYRSRTYISTGYQGTLGFGFATGLGVKIANPDKLVICISGDGGFMYNAQELATAVLHQIPLVTIIFNDNAYGNIKAGQIGRFGGRIIGTDLHNPNYVQFAESFGAAGYLANTADELRWAIKKGFENKGPTIIEVPVGHLDMPSPWHMIQRPWVRPKK